DVFHRQTGTMSAARIQLVAAIVPDRMRYAAELASSARARHALREERSWRNSRQKSHRATPSVPFTAGTPQAYRLAVHIPISRSADMHSGMHWVWASRPSLSGGDPC